MSSNPATRAMRTALADFGDRILTQPALLEGVLMDLEPHETRLFSALLAATRHGMLRQMYDGPRLDAAEAKRLAHRLSSLSGITSSIALEAVVCAAVAMDRGDEAALRQALKPEPVVAASAPPAGVAQPRRSITALLGIVGVLGVASLGLLWPRGGAPEATPNPSPAPVPPPVATRPRPEVSPPPTTPAVRPEPVRRMPKPAPTDRSRTTRRERPAQSSKRTTKTPRPKPAPARPRPAPEIPRARERVLPPEG